jgi:hypothetical protein
MRALLLACSLVLCPAAQAELSIGIALPGVSIGINMPVYPQLERVPGYPVYYAPHASSNYFFYDGLYWVYQGDDWYASNWYNGPWRRYAQDAVPLFVLRVPVRYYRQPPPHFRGWQRDAPPRWGEHWGRDWEDQHRGWDKWDRKSAPRAAPLPTYQREYSGKRYPRDPVQQHDVQSRHYRYERAEPIDLRNDPRPRMAPVEQGGPRGGDRGAGNPRDEDQREQRGDDRGNGRGKERGQGDEHGKGKH